MNTKLMKSHQEKHNTLLGGRGALGKWGGTNSTIQPCSPPTIPISCCCKKLNYNNLILQYPKSKKI